MIMAVLEKVDIVRRFFIVKEIVSKDGIVHFRRYRLLSTPWFNIYIHNILQSDLDAHPHDHPWHFISLILWGGYIERWLEARNNYWYWMGREMKRDKHTMGSMVYHNAKDFHQITLLKPSVWTLVFTWGKRKSWGYQTRSGWMDHKTYRQLKNEGKLPI